MRLHAALASLIAALLWPAASVDEQSKSRNGLFLASGDTQLELTAYAEPTWGRRLKMTRGAVDDVPLVAPAKDLRILCRLPSWQPSGLVVAAHAVFSEDNSETRTLPFATRALNVFAVEVRSADLEQPAAVARLLDSVKASPDNPGYLFVVLFSGGLIRYYPARLALELQRSDRVKSISNNVHIEDTLLSPLPQTK